MDATEAAAWLERRTSTSLAVGLGVSLVAHVALLWRITSVQHSTPELPEPPPSEEIVFETLGLVSDKQVEERKAGDERTPGANLPAVSKPAAPPSPHPARATKTATSPEGDRSAPEAPDGGSEAGESPASAGEGAPQGGVGAADMNQVARTIQPSDPSDTQVLRQYVVALRRVIQSRLVYPAQAREANQEGAPVIRFTVSVGGDILPGSLTVVRSSGYALLDDNAIKAARESAPLPPPPRPMTVSIAVAFVREPQ